MINLKKKSQTLILLVLVIILSINTDFFKKLYEVISWKFDLRIAKNYGYCRGESVGWLLDIKSKPPIILPIVNKIFHNLFIIIIL
mgnify:CR=1 FL=1